MIDFDRLNFDPGNMNKNFVLSLQLKEHPEISKIANFGEKYSRLKCGRLCPWALPTFPVRNTNIIKNPQTSQGYVFSVFYNISPQNFSILLILGCYFYSSCDETFCSYCLHRSIVKFLRARQHSLPNG